MRNPRLQVPTLASAASTREWLTKPAQALLIAGNRVGGTFLNIALSNHPQIFCARGEPFHRQSPWRAAVPEETIRIKLLWGQLGYAVSMFKINEVYVRGNLRSAIEKNPDLRILSLDRENSLEQAVSTELNRMHRKGALKSHPTHSFSEVNPESVTLNVESIVKEYGRTIGAKNRVKQTLRGLKNPILYLTYEQITDGEEVSQIPEKVSWEICEFLGVEPVCLKSHLRKIHKHPYEEIVTNWHEILEAVR